MKTNRLTDWHGRPARPRRRTGLAVETMEQRLVLSTTLPVPHAGATAAVMQYFPPTPVMPAAGAGLSAYFPPDPCMNQSYHAAWADGPVNDQGLADHPIAVHTRPQPPSGGNGGEPIVHPYPSPPPGGNGGRAF
jgi:hypothetical protein